MVNNNKESLILKKVRTLFLQNSLSSKIIISGLTKEPQLNRKKHFHDLFEIRFLFGYDEEKNVDYENLLEIRLTPSGFVHYGLENLELKSHISLKFDVHFFVFMIGINQINIPFNDKFNHYGINIIDLLTVLNSYCQGKLEDLGHLQFVLGQFISAFACFIEENDSVSTELPMQICNYIHEHYYQSDLSAADIAQVIGLSANYIQQLFRKSNNSTIHEYLVNYRLHIAQRILKQKKYQIKEVARLSGWNCPHYFSNCFHKKFGYPPSAE
jgi:AraC-like DNA-binding protein